MKIAFIGGGVMGEAMVSTLLNRKVVEAEAILVSDIDQARRKALAEKYGVQCTGDNRNAIDCDVMILAVKPQSLSEVLAELRGRLRPNQLVLSIVAGASTKTISEGLGHDPVARVMPNIAVQVGEGVCIWTATEAVSPAQRERARTILAELGKEIYVRDERYIDMATAVSGSGPAFIFLVVEALIEAAVHIGLPLGLAKELVLQTMLGSVRLAQASGKHPAELRNMVTSPGGTTAEGLLRLEEGGARAILAQAVIAAHEKAKALAHGSRG
jgi:pyrroline-5-carboxylate reductase